MEIWSFFKCKGIHASSQNPTSQKVGVGSMVNPRSQVVGAQPCISVPWIWTFLVLVLRPAPVQEKLGVKRLPSLDEGCMFLETVCYCGSMIIDSEIFRRKWGKAGNLWQVWGLQWITALNTYIFTAGRERSLIACVRTSKVGIQASKRHGFLDAIWFSIKASLSQNLPIPLLVAKQTKAEQWQSACMIMHQAATFENVNLDAVAQLGST